MTVSPNNCRMELEATIANPLFWALAEAYDAPAYEIGLHSKRRDHPDWAMAVFHVGTAIFGSAKNTERQLHDGSYWPFIVSCVRKYWGHKAVRRRDHPNIDQAPELHHWNYFKQNFIVGNRRAAHLEKLLRRSGVATSRVLGLCDGTVKLSLQHPDPRNVIFADAKTIKALNKLVRQRTYQHGGGPKTGSLQVVIVGCRGSRVHERVVLGIEPVTQRGQEMKVTKNLVDGLLAVGLDPHVLLYDGAMRGVNMLHYLSLGIAVISPLARGPHGTVRTHNLGSHPVRQGTRSSVVVFAKEGAPGAYYTDHAGIRRWVALDYKRERRGRRRGAYAWYLKCFLPPALGGGYVRVRVDKDKTTAENLRLFPKADPEYPRLYPQRSQIESLNRHLDDRLYQGRAHSASEQGQRADCVVWGFLVNSVALFLHGNPKYRGAAGLAAMKSAGILPP